MADEDDVTDEQEPDRFLDQFNAPAEAAYHWLETRGLIHAKCPICGNTEWAVEYRADPESDQIDYNAPVFVLKDPRSFFGPAPAIPTLAFTCTGCGFLRLHNISWITGEQGEGGGVG